jgi:hypothetical protein
MMHPWCIVHLYIVTETKRRPHSGCIVSWTKTEKSAVPFPLSSIDIDYLIFSRKASVPSTLIAREPSV